MPIVLQDEESVQKMLYGFNSRDGHFVTPAERKALGADNVPEFFMHFAIAGHELNHAWIDEILEARAWRIFDAAIHETDGFWNVLSHEDFVILCCKDSRIPGPRAIKFIEMIESLSPGVVARARDGEGNDALACTFLREKMKPEDRTDLSKWKWTVVPELQKTLIRYGCKAKEQENDEAE